MSGIAWRTWSQNSLWNSTQKIALEIYITGFPKRNCNPKHHSRALKQFQGDLCALWISHLSISLHSMNVLHLLEFGRANEMAILLDKNYRLSVISYSFPILVRRLLVSGQTWEELATPHFCLYRRKAGQSKDQQLFVDPSEDRGPKPTVAPNTGERDR